MAVSWLLMAVERPYHAGVASGGSVEVRDVLRT
jgi:hypothetical protein